MIYPTTNSTASLTTIIQSFPTEDQQLNQASGIFISKKVIQQIEPIPLNTSPPLITEQPVVAYEKWIPYDQRHILFGFSALRRFQKYWMSVFNRRIKVIKGYPIQIGDLFFVGGFLAFLLFQVINYEYVPDCKHQGKIVSIIMLLTIIFGCRNGLINFIFGVSLERAVMWHKFLGWSTVILSIDLWVHSHYSLDGVLMEVPIIALVVFSLVPIRRKAWEFFIKVHWLMILFLFVISIIHGVPYGYAGCVMFFIDVIIRVYYSQKYSKIQSQFSLERVGTDLVKIIVPHKNEIKYMGGQYFFIMIPKLTYFQWHPFSVASAPHQDNIIFYVKSLGDWTRALYNLSGEKGNAVSVKGYIDGPYGNHSISIDNNKYEHFLCISGGVGITPIISTAKELVHQKLKGRPLKSINFIWSTRDESMAYNILANSDVFHQLNSNEEGIVKAFYHLTANKNVKEGEGDKENKSAQQYVDENQQSISESANVIDLIDGRPNFKKYFEETFQQAKQTNSKLVAVLVCGPSNLTSQIEYLGEEFSRQGVRFDVHQEVFEF